MFATDFGSWTKSIFFAVTSTICTGPSADTVVIQRVASLQQPSLYTVLKFLEICKQLLPYDIAFAHHKDKFIMHVVSYHQCKRP